MNSSRFDIAPTLTPFSLPNDDTHPLAFLESSGQVAVSLSRAISRLMANPIWPSPLPLKRSCDNGMRNSASQPSASRFTVTSHTASQLSSLLLSLYQYASCLTPSGLTPN